MAHKSAGAFRNSTCSQRLECFLVLWTFLLLFQPLVLFFALLVSCFFFFLFFLATLNRCAPTQLSRLILTFCSAVREYLQRTPSPPPHCFALNSCFWPYCLLSAIVIVVIVVVVVCTSTMFFFFCALNDHSTWPIVYAARCSLCILNYFLLHVTTFLQVSTIFVVLFVCCVVAFSNGVVCAISGG